LSLRATVASSSSSLSEELELRLELGSDGSEGRRSMKIVGGSAGLLRCLLSASVRPSSAWKPGSLGADLR